MEEISRKDHAAALDLVNAERFCRFCALWGSDSSASCYAGASALHRLKDRAQGLIPHLLPAPASRKRHYFNRSNKMMSCPPSL